MINQNSGVLLVTVLFLCCIKVGIILHKMWLEMCDRLDDARMLVGLDPIYTCELRDIIKGYRQYKKAVTLKGVK